LNHLYLDEKGSFEFSLGVEDVVAPGNLILPWEGRRWGQTSSDGVSMMDEQTHQHIELPGKTEQDEQLYLWCISSKMLCLVAWVTMADVDGTGDGRDHGVHAPTYDL
jgi:hypothetical protein